MLSAYTVGDTITVRIGAMEGNEIIVKGEVEEIREGNPPCKCSTLLPTERFCYRLKGKDTFYRESAIIDGQHRRVPKEAYSPLLECVPPLTLLPA